MAICIDYKCKTCKWYAKFEGVCCNPDSSYVADFTDAEDWCAQYEVEE